MNTVTSNVAPSPDNLPNTSNEPKVTSVIDDDPFFNDLFGDSSLFRPTKVEVSNEEQLKAATSASIIEIQPYSYQEDTLNLASYFVKELTIAERSCSLVTEFRLCSLPSLRVLTIEKNCFVSNAKQGGTFSISDCPSLESVDIGHACFYRYEKFQIEHCDKLRSLKIGELTHESMCFQNVSFELSDLPALKEVVLGRRSFRNASSITFSNLPCLETITFGMSAVKGATKSSSLVMRNLPALRSVQSDGNSFSMISRACLEDIPNCTLFNLPEGFKKCRQLFIDSSKAPRLALLCRCKPCDRADAKAMTCL